jgi:hypothetical protein
MKRGEKASDFVLDSAEHETQALRPNVRGMRILRAVGIANIIQPGLGQHGRTWTMRPNVLFVLAERPPRQERSHQDFDVNASY